MPCNVHVYRRRTPAVFHWYSTNVGASSKAAYGLLDGTAYDVVIAVSHYGRSETTKKGFGLASSLP